MQNWNQWQLSAGAVATSMPQPPVGYATPGADPMAMMQAYMQYYNQPAPTGYTAEQWAAAQQQNWAQWQQWQQQYQQWQAQYGEKYQETIKHMSAQSVGLANQVPPLPIVQPPPPLPKEDTKPPLPPSTINTYQFTSIPPPHQNNLPLFPVKQNANSTIQTSVQTCPPNPPLPSSQPPLPPENSSSKENILTGKRSSSTVSESSSAKKLKVDEEELTEAEKTFDAQFKQWEEQFNKWKQQNANHPDKTQYKQYEAKWTSWREKLIERREQMRKKREQQKQAAAKVEAEKSKTLPGDDKILNILSNTENQGLINNLLGIGKTLGLTGKQNASVPPPPPPPPATQSSASSVQTTVTPSPQITTQPSASQLPPMHMMSSTVTATPWNTQQWPPQYNAGMNISNFPGFQPLTGVPPPPFGVPQTQMPPPNFAQPPPNFSSGTPNFSQPPPGFPSNDGRQSHNARPLTNMQGRPPFGSNDTSVSDTNLLGNERQGQSGPLSNFEHVGQSNKYGTNELNRQKDGVPSDRFGPDSKNLSGQQGNQFQPSDAYGSRNENYKLNDDRGPEADQFRRDRSYQDHGNNQFNQQKLNYNNDRFTSGNDRFGQGNDHCGPTGDRFGQGNDRFGPGGDRFGPGNNRFGPGNDRFGLGNDRFGPGNDRFGPGNDRIGQGNESNNDRFGGNNDRFGPNNEHFGPGNDRYGRNNMDRFNQKDGADNRRDSFSNNSRGFNRNMHIEPPDKFAPELKKLMEKRKAAMDVFKPSYLDSEKCSSVGSLSESFKRITGDSPFIPKTSTDFGGPKGNNNFGPRGPMLNFGPGNYRMPGDFKPHGGPELGPRGPVEFGPPNNAFSSSSQVQEFASAESKSDAINLGNIPIMDKDIVRKENEPGTMGKTELTDSTVNEQNLEQDAPIEHTEDIPLLEKPPWVDAQFPQGNLLEKDNKSDKENGNTANIECPGIAEQDTQKISNEQGEMKKDLPNSGKDGMTQKCDALPFMGENDPKPEDLNMEPPPELPNLGPVSTEVNESNDTVQRVNEPLRSFPMNQECFEPTGGFDAPGPRGMPFRPNAPSLFGLRGPHEGRFAPFEPRGPNAFPLNPPGPNPHQLGPRGPNNGQFGLRGPNDGQFGSRGPNAGQFGSRGPNDAQFGPRSCNDGQFGPQGPNNRQFPPCRPNDTQFENRGPGEAQSGFSGPNDRFFGTRRSNDALSYQRGPNDNAFGPRGANDGQFSNRGSKDGPFTPRGFNERQFESSNDNYFGGQSSNDRFFGLRGPMGGPNDGLFASRNRSEGLFNNRPPFGGRGLGDFGPRGPLDNSSCPKASNEKHLERNEPGASDSRGDLGGDHDNMLMDKNMDQNQCFGPGDMQKPGWRHPYSKNNFGDVDQRSGRDPNKPEIFNQSGSTDADQRASLSLNKTNTLPDKRSEKTDSLLSSVRDFKPGYSESSSGSDFNKFGTHNLFMKRSMDNRQSQGRGPIVKEFCIEKQFNYNHGGAGVDKKLVEHVPVKVIDYAHASRTTVQDHVTPLQCFDYGHGNLKPVVPDREAYPSTDFKHWEENEQNLRDYTEKIRRYEHYAEKRDYRRSGDYNQRRDSEGSMDDRKWERERRDRERDDYKGKERREEKIFDRMTDKDQESRYKSDRNTNKERPQERCETSQKESKKDTDKDEDRSKGNINWQDSSNKNIIETKPPDPSVSDSQHNVLEPPPKTLELAKTPNCTMVDDLLCPPGRQNRPPKIAIILRGPPGSGKSFVAKLIKDKEVEQGGSAPRILSLDDYFLIEKEIESKDDNGKKVVVKEMVYEYEEAMEQSYVTSLVKAFKKNITDGFFNFIILDCINEKISDYEEMWSFAKTKGFKVYVCEMEMDLQICLKRNIHNRTEEEINRIIDYFEPTPSYHQKLDVNSMLQEQAIEEVHMEDSEETEEKTSQINEDSQDSQEDAQDTAGVSKWERMEAEDKLDRLDGLARKKNEGNVQTMKDFLQVPDYYNMEDTSGKKRVRWADLEERKEQEKMRAVGFVVGHTNWDRMMDPTKGGSALTRTKFFSLS